MTITEQKQQGQGEAARLPLSFRLAAFALPALVGFVLASAILWFVGPFQSTIELVAWLLVAFVVSFAIATFTAEVVQRAVRRTDTYRNTIQFDSQVDELFGEYLRTGNIRTLRKTAQENGHSLTMIDAVAAQLDELTKHDRLTRGHTERVRAYASLIGNEMGLPEDQVELLNWTAMMHDIGKLDVPGNILNKPGKPTPEEWDVLKGHPWAAFKRLNMLEEHFGESIYEGALYHHERWDGTGYPFGLTGNEIPLFGRITAVADAFDVMTHARSYKDPSPIGEARDELLRAAGSHFDPNVVAAFVRIGEQDLREIRGLSATFAGLSLVGSQVGSVVSNVAISVATLVGAGVTIAAAEEPPPAAVAFASEEAPDTTVAPTTTTLPETTTTAPPTTIETTTTTIAETTTTTTTTIPDTLITLNYAISTNLVDGLEATVDADQLIVFVDDVEASSHPLAPGQRLVPVVFNLTELGVGQHIVRFELFNNGVLVSTDETIIFG